jgi:hypothetical protein
MKKYLLLLWVAVTALVMGCSSHHYVVEMKAKDEAVERKLICWRGGGPENDTTTKPDDFPADELAALTRLYPKHETTQEGKRHAFTGEFRGRLPDDVGGHGTFTSYVTELGGAFVYIERFRGNSDIAAELEERLKATDQLADYLLGWFAAELGKDPRFENLRQFLDGDFRRDLRNLTLYLWTEQFSTAANSNSFESSLLRCWQFLIERGYVKTEDLILLVAQADLVGKKRWSLLLQRLVACKMGVPESQPVPASLAFLADEESIGKTFEKYLAGTPAYRAKLEEWEKAKQKKPDTPKPRPTEVTEELAAELIGFRLFQTDDYLTVRLSTAVKPMATNGEWKEDSLQVVWDSRIRDKTQSRGSLPLLCYAAWSVPNEAKQKRRFGQMLLSGEDLLKYGVWRHSLTAAQAREWDALLATLTPDNFQAKLKGFRFSDDARKSDPLRTDEEQAALASYPQKLFEPPKPPEKR